MFCFLIVVTEAAMSLKKLVDFLGGSYWEVSVLACETLSALCRSVGRGFVMPPGDVMQRVVLAFAQELKHIVPSRSFGSTTAAGLTEVALMSAAFASAIGQDGLSQSINLQVRTTLASHAGLYIEAGFLSTALKCAAPSRVRMFM